MSEPTISLVPKKDDAHVRHGHVLPASVLLGTGIALLALTVVTVAVSRVDLGEWNVAVALGIACLKASLVALFFMHLKYEDKFQAVVLVGSLFFVVVMVAFVLFDTVQYQPDIQKKRADDEKAQLVR